MPHDQRRESQNKRLLKYLIQGRSIAPKRASFIMGIERLAARIKDLRYKGIVIEDQMEFHGPVKFKRYWINPKTVKAYKQAHP